jgi:hypothetical protein
MRNASVWATRKSGWLDPCCPRNEHAVGRQCAQDDAGKRCDDLLRCVSSSRFTFACAAVKSAWRASEPAFSHRTPARRQLFSAASSPSVSTWLAPAQDSPQPAARFQLEAWFNFQLISGVLISARVTGPLRLSRRCHIPFTHVAVRPCATPLSPDCLGAAGQNERLAAPSGLQSQRCSRLGADHAPQRQRRAACHVATFRPKQRGKDHDGAEYGPPAQTAPEAPGGGLKVGFERFRMFGCSHSLS